MHTGRSDERIPNQLRPYALSTHVAADHSAYHVSVDAGPYHIAYADVRPTGSTVELSIDVTTGNPSPRLRRRLIDAVFDLDVMHSPRTLLATLPLGDVDLLDDMAQHCVSVHTRAAGHSCLVDGQAFGITMPRRGVLPVADLSGLDIAWPMRQSAAAQRNPDIRYIEIADVQQRR